MDGHAERTEVTGNSVFADSTAIDINYDFTMAPGGANTAPWMVVGQLHDLNISSSPSFDIEIDTADHMRVSIGWFTATPSSVTPSIWRTTVAGQAAGYGWAYVDPSPIQRGHAYAMQISVRFNTINGSLRIFRDGAQIVNYQGPLGFGVGHYWKMGIYRAPTTNDTQVADYGNFTISP
jgi:hypothetical protein